MNSYIPEIPQQRLDNLERCIGVLAANSITSGEMAKKVLALQRGLTGDRSILNREYMNEQDYLLAYLSYYWPVSYAQAQLALRQLALKPLALRRWSSGPLRILDLGSGPGSMSCAAVDCVMEYMSLPFPAQTAIEITLFDLSRPAMNIAEELLKSNVMQREVRVACLQGNLGADTLPEGEFDLILIGHSLNEIAHNRADRIDIRTGLVKSALARLSDSGFMVIIEPSLLSTSRDLIELRNNLCEEGYRIHGPCTTNAVCSIVQTSAVATCHDESLWKIPHSVQKIADAAGLDRNAVKMTWFAFSKSALPSFNDESIFRVVSEPMLNKGGRVRYLLCGQKTRIPFSAKKDDAAAMAGGFFRIKRGDVISVENPEFRESGLGWQSETRLIQKDRFLS